MKPVCRWLLLTLGALAAGGLLWIALRDVSWAELGRVLSQLRAWQLIVILVVNAAMILLFALRWFLILRSQGHTIPYVDIARYRLAAFAISYFTPGQHFGGEPLQVILLQRKHKVETATAVASVALDKAMELFANFAVLAAGIAVLLASDMFSGSQLKSALPIAIWLLVLALAYLLAIALGWRPLSWLARRISNALTRALAGAEDQLADLVRKPSLLLQCLLASALVWAALFFEFWLMLRFLGLNVDGMQLLAVVIAGRIALLAPTPGALGALEASQVLAMQALGFDPAYGLALGLLIRARDVFFATIGLALGGAEGLAAYRRTAA
jgi:uncharacterized protein (TIRG00374 family)